ncbi:MAG: septum formation protein Maf [Dehalococcoidia bacterium]|nr:septum formation protein Maf [Dehalococcoidia bacterium]
MVLASASPRRRDLLAALGAAFEVTPADVDETTDERDPVRVAEGLSLRKARAVADGSSDARAVLGSDTVVVLDGRILGKPADASEARSTLRALRDRGHEVVTGVAVVCGERAVADHARTAVWMRDYSDEEIEAYVTSGDPMDKAGAYAIQHPDFAPVARIEGCECSVVGLPLWTVRRLLRAAGGIEAGEPTLERCRACPLAPTRV